MKARKVEQLSERFDPNTSVIALGNIVKNMPGHLYWKDKNGIYKGCNDRQAKSLGMKSPSEVIGKTDFELPWPKNSAEQFWENDQKIMRNRNSVVLEEFSILDGKETTVLSQKTPLINENGEVEGILGISIDISKQKEAERQLMKEKKKVEQSDQLKTAFIQNMEHDIRTPISGVFGLLDVLSKEENNPKNKEIISMLINASKELLDYCNGLLDFTKLEAGPQPVTEKPIDLQNFLESIFSLERPTAKQKNIELSYSISSDLPQVILSDEFRLKRILLNLIGNALKFTQLGSVEVSINQILPVQNRCFVLEISVEDTGIGIPDDKQNLIYQKYVKVSPSNKGLYKGTGLGLSMVKQFVGELNGEIQLESEIGKGSMFTVLIPVKKSLLSGLTVE